MVDLRVSDGNLKKHHMYIRSQFPGRSDTAARGGIEMPVRPLALSAGR